VALAYSLLLSQNFPEGIFENKENPHSQYWSPLLKSETSTPATITRHANNCAPIVLVMNIIKIKL
jgi:hypothetical protein